MLTNNTDQYDNANCSIMLRANTVEKSVVQNDHLHVAAVIEVSFSFIVSSIESRVRPHSWRNRRPLDQDPIRSCSSHLAVMHFFCLAVILHFLCFE